MLTSNRLHMPLGDWISNLTARLSWTEEAVGQSILLVFSLQGCILDNRDETPARFAFLAGARAFLPQGVTLQLLGSDLPPGPGPYAEGSLPFEPRTDPVYTVQLLLTIPEGSPTEYETLLTLYGPQMGTATEEPPGWPVVTATGDAPVALETVGGTEIPLRVILSP